MADIVVRGLADEVVRRVRSDAALRGESLREWVGRVVEAAIRERSDVVGEQGQGEYGLGSCGESGNGTLGNDFEQGDDDLKRGDGDVREQGSRTETGHKSFEVTDTQKMGKPRGPKKLTAEEFQGLKPSERLRAQREGKV